MTKQHTALLQIVEDDCSGEIGAIVAGLDLGSDNYDPYTTDNGALLAHDILEHQNGIEAIGTVEDELEALGGLWYVRGESGALQRGGNYHTPVVNVAADVARMFALWDGYASEPCADDVDIEDALAEILRHAECDASDDWDRDGDRERALGEFSPEWEAYSDAVRNRMRTGYAKARARFPNQDEANAQFWAIVDAVQPFLRYMEFGQELRLTYGDGRAECVEVITEDWVDE